MERYGVAGREPSDWFQVTYSFFFCVPYFRLSKLSFTRLVFSFTGINYNALSGNKLNAPCLFLFRGPQSASGLFQQMACIPWQITVSSDYDFRGCGFISLENLLFFATTYPVCLFSLVCVMMYVPETKVIWWNLDSSILYIKWNP